MSRIIDPNTNAPAGKAPLDQPFLVAVNEATLEVPPDGRRKLYVRLQLLTLDKKQPLSLPIHLPGEAIPLIITLFQQVVEKHPELTTRAVQVVGEKDVEEMRQLIAHEPKGEPS